MSQSYQPIHHKYRPQRFDDLIGQESIAQTLKQAINTNRIAPAYLFSGPRGTGKTSSARILARSLNCIKNDLPTDDPCGNCDLCKTIALGTALDVIEIDAASNTGVDNIRDLIEKSQFSPVQARWKVYVIDECHMLSTAAFNALLKTLEEPPKKVVFILATTDPQRVLPTILSRCQKFDFRRIPLQPLIKHLGMIAQQEKIVIEDQALEIIAKKAQGGLRDAESMLDQLSLLPPPIKLESVWDLLGEIPENELLALASSLTNEDPISVLEICRNLLDIGRDPIAILQGFASIIRDLIVKNAAPENLDLCSISKESQETLKHLASKVALKDLLRWQSQLKGSESQLRHSLQPRLWLEVLLLGLLSNSNNVESKNIKYIEKNNMIDKNFNAISDKSESKIKAKPIDLNIEDLNKDNNTEGEFKVHTSEDMDKNLVETWSQILASLELPSTRMLLSQQAKLISLTKQEARINVSPSWISMIQSRKILIEEAIKQTLGSHRNLIIITENDSPKKQKKELGTQKQESKHISNNELQISRNINLKIENQEIKKNDFQTNQNTKSGLKTENVDHKAKNLAEFFNGEIVNLDE